MERVEIYGRHRQAARRARQVPAAHAESSPPRARQRLHAAHAKCAAHAEPPIDSWHMYAKYSACAEPSRQDRRHAASRQDWSLGGTHADSTPAHAKQTCAAATPSQPSTPGRTTAPPMPSRAAKTGGTPPTPRPRTPSAPPTPSRPSTPGTRTPSAPPMPSRAAKTGAPSDSTAARRANVTRILMRVSFRLSPRVESRLSTFVLCRPTRRTAPRPSAGSSSLLLPPLFNVAGGATRRRTRARGPRLR